MAAARTILGEDGALFTDLYQLTMAASYWAEQMFAPATFSFFVRKYPPGRGYFVAAGLHEVVRYLESFRFSTEALGYLEQSGQFSAAFLAYLRDLRFGGDVDALAEGTLCFANEPILEITAPLPQAQIVETFVINQLNLQTMLATKAARCVTAAAGRTVIDFSLRRAQGVDAGMQVARCSFLAGADGTSNVLAGKEWGIPTYGTMAHSYIESFDTEVESFRAYARAFPRTSTFLVDTYDTIAGVRAAIRVGLEMQRAGTPLRAIRLDSGDLAELSRASRTLLDEAGLHEVGIFASGGLTEYTVEELVAAGAPIDAFGIGTEMGVSGDAPWLDCAYKLVEYAGRPRLKLSAGKTTWAGRKQLWRATIDSHLMRDCISLHAEPASDIAQALGLEEGHLVPQLRPVMRGGRLVDALPGLGDSREHFHRQFAALDSAYKRLRAPADFPVDFSPALLTSQARAEAAVRQAMS